MSVVVVDELDELAAALAWERAQHEPAFRRIERRRTRLKRRCDCGCWIDGGEPYRYEVWKPRGVVGVAQRLDCEFCARRDGRY